MHALLLNASAVGLVLLVLVSGVAVWIEIGRRWLQRLPAVAYEPRRPVPWTALEIVLIMAAYLFLQVASVYVVFGLAGQQIRSPHDRSSHHSAKPDATEPDAMEEPEEMNPERYTAMLLANVLGNVLTAAATLALLRTNVTLRLPPMNWRRMMAGFLPRFAATWSDLGLTRPTWRDLGLGLAAFAAAVIPVYALQAVLTQFTEERHPIVEMLEENMSFGLMAVSVLTAVGVAPFVEELLFRVALQGWLERVQILATNPSASDAGDSANLDPPNIVNASGAQDENPYAAPLAAQPALPKPAQPNRLMPWPIVISSLAFALAHLGNGPDPIPLFFLALILGYVYQRTHRLWPSLVVHFTLNSCSMFMLWLQAMRK